MLSRLAIDGSSISSSSPRFDFQACTITLLETFPDTNGLRGSLSHDVSRFPTGIRRVSGQLRMEPNAAEMGLILPWIMGTAATGSGPATYALSDVVLPRNLQLDKVAKVFTYNSVGVDHCSFSATQGEPLSVSMDLVGTDETVGASFTSTAAIDTATTPWMFQQCALTVNGTTVNARSLEISISNMIDTGRFFNSPTLVSLVKRDRSITFRTELPYGDYFALYNVGTGPAGIACIATFTNGASVLTMTMANVVIPRTAPTVAGRTEIMLPLTGVCASAGSTKELTISV